MRCVVWLLLAALVVLQQARLFRDDSSLLFDWFPVGLAYQGGISLAAGVVWILACRFAWPAEMFPERPENSPATAGSGEARP